VSQPEPRLTAVIFDFDGTLIDSERMEFESWARIFEDHGARLTTDIWAEFVGVWVHPRIFDVLRGLTDREVDEEAILARHDQMYPELSQHLTLMPGVEALANAVTEAGLRTAICTNSDREWVNRHWQRLGLHRWFDDDHVYTGDMHRPHKPAPDLYHLTLHGLGVPDREVVVLEDSVHGATAALAAGLTVFAIPTAVSRQAAYPAGTRVVASMHDLTVDDLRRALCEKVA
jgi:HAD superfamily hydrolase (TIGR01509 family)